MENEQFQDMILAQFAKLFKEVQEVKESQIRMETRLDNVEESQVRMETEFGKKLDVLYCDWRETQKQFNEEIKIEIRNLHTKVEALQMESTKHEQEIRNLYLVKAPIE
ncbi:MAG: hypothetical protein ACYCV0_16270 [Desulfitobacteriaceae bacterium]